MKVRVKKLHPNAVIPKYAKPGDAGLDLTAVSREVKAVGKIVYHTGLAFEIPEGYVGLIFPRSSVRNFDIILSNCVGVIDSGFRGEITFTFRYLLPITYLDNDIVIGPTVYEVGDRIGQLVIIPYPQVELEESDDLTETERGTTGFGSSGR